MNPQLTKIASSGTIPGLAKLLNQYFYSEKYEIKDDLIIIHPTKDINESFKVKKVKNRFILYHT